MTDNLPVEHRPRTFKEVVGQPEAVRKLVELGRQQALPHALLFTGPSGCGKTTLARIVAAKLKCSGPDLHEINAADFRGIDTVRGIRDKMSLAPMHGSSRVWLIDECHQLTSAAQELLLKPLEEPPSHVYFMLATTNPAKLLKTILTRCTEIRCKTVDAATLTSLVQRVADLESPDSKVSDAVIDRIVTIAEGSPRKALVLLQGALTSTDEDQQLAAVEAGDYRAEGIELARLLFNGAKWPDVAKVLKAIPDDEVETTRWIVMGYARSVLLGGKVNARAVRMLECFLEPFYDSKANGLCHACLACLSG